MPFEGPYQLAYQAAMITVGFKSYAYNFQASDDPGGLFNIDPDTSFIYATQDIDVGEESLEFRPGSCSYATAAGPGGAINLTIPINAPQSIPFAHAIMRLTFNKLPYLPTNSIGLYNNLNNGTFLGCQAGTVKFKGTSTHREFQNRWNNDSDND